MKQKWSIIRQKGNALIFLIVGAIFLALILLPGTYSKLPSESFADQCLYNPPLASRTFKDGTETFELIKATAPIITVQRKVHLGLEKTITVDGVERTVTKVHESDKNDGISNWYVDGVDPNWQNVRFVDVSDTIPDKSPGTSYYDIYLKQGAQIPAQIIRFCDENPSETRGFVSDNYNQSFPPTEIDAASITNWHCEVTPAGGQPEYDRCMGYFGPIIPNDDTYYLYAYDTDTSEVVKLVKGNGMGPIGKIRLEYNGKMQVFDIVFYNWESKHFRLEFTDPKTGEKIGYRYASPERLAIPEDPYKFLNNVETKVASDTLQLQTFSPWKIPAAGWWTPECKPAIYLYPKHKMNINVKVKPEGMFTYTDPVYDPQKGWNVTAYPDGTLSWLDNVFGINSKGEKRQTNIYNYLYYESKIHDSMIQKPTEGYVIAKSNLENFYHTTLPKLGLNEKEVNDYVDYWQDILPQSDYYFIGLLSDQNVNQIEPLTVTPPADSTLRVRLYYEVLNTAEAEKKLQNLKQPDLPTNFERNGFTVVEWGGMVKQDKDHPFTCSI